MLTVILFLINRMEGNRPIKDGTTNQNESSEVICFSILKLSPGLLRPAMIGPGLMPTLKVLLRTGLCGYGLGRCGSREHIAWVATAAVAAGFLISVAVRFARVNFKLRNLEVR